jgi:hypothetical protein
MVKFLPSLKKLQTVNTGGRGRGLCLGMKHYMQYSFIYTYFVFVKPYNYTSL